MRHRRRCTIRNKAQQPVILASTQAGKTHFPRPGRATRRGGLRQPGGHKVIQRVTAGHRGGNLLLAADTLSVTTQASIASAVASISVATDAGKLNRVRAAIHLVLCAPEYLVQV